MRSGFWPRALVVGLALFAAGEVRAGGNLVVNGGFETGSLSGWQVSGNTGFTMVTDHEVGLAGFGPDATHSGSFYALLGPVGSMGHLSQTIATTAGDTYVVSWWIASDSDTRNEFAVSWNGSTLVDQKNVPREGYQLETETVVATGPTSLLMFSYQNDPGFFSLDDISVAVVPTSGKTLGTLAVPEPSGLVLVGLGLAAVLAARQSGISLTRRDGLR